MRAAIIAGELSGQARCLNPRSLASIRPVASLSARPSSSWPRSVLVSIQPQRGAFVVKISVADVLDPRLSAKPSRWPWCRSGHFSPASTIKELRQLIERQKEVMHGQNAEFLALDEEFHRTISLSVGRAHAWRVIEGIKAQIDRIRYLSLDDATPLPLLIEQHSRILDGIRRGQSRGGRCGDAHSR